MCKVPRGGAVCFLLGFSSDTVDVRRGEVWKVVANEWGILNKCFGRGDVEELCLRLRSHTTHGVCRRASSEGVARCANGWKKSKVATCILARETGRCFLFSVWMLVQFGIFGFEAHNAIFAASIV